MQKNLDSQELLSSNHSSQGVTSLPAMKDMAKAFWEQRQRSLKSEVERQSQAPAQLIGLEQASLETSSVQAQQDESNLSAASYRLGKIYFDKLDFSKAESYFLSALEHCQLPEEGLVVLKICGFLVRIYSESLKKDQAADFIDMSKMVENVLETNRLSAEHLFFKGVVASYYGEDQVAQQQFHLAAKKAQENNEPDVLAKSLLSLAQNYYREKDFKAAIKTLGQLEQLLGILQKGYLRASMYLLYGNIMNQVGEFHTALKYFDQSTKELVSKACWNLLGYTFLGRGISYKKLGDSKLSLMNFQMAQTLAHPKHSKKLLEKINGELSDVQNTNVDFFIDRHNRVITEKELGTIDFKHRFVLLEILFLLAQNPGKFFDKDQLSKEIWKDEYNPLIHDKLIYTSISRLRKLVEPNPDRSKYILRGKDGYTFNPQIKVSFYQGQDVNNDSIANVDLGSPL